MSILEKLNTETEMRTCPVHGEKSVYFTPYGSDEMICNACFREAQAKTSEQVRLAESRKLAELVRSENLQKAQFTAAVPPRFADKTFETYQADTQEKQRALNTCQRFLMAIDDGGTLLLSGKKGTGKTHLGAATVNEYLALRGDKTALFTKSSKVLSKMLEASSFDADMTHTETLRYFASFDLLVIDEVGRHRMTEKAVNDLFEIIDERYDERKATMIISNKTPDELNQYVTESGMDRLLEYGGVVRFDWESHRRQK